MKNKFPMFFECRDYHEIDEKIDDTKSLLKKLGLKLSVRGKEICVERLNLEFPGFYIGMIWVGVGNLKHLADLILPGTSFHLLMAIFASGSRSSSPAALGSSG